MKWRKASEPPKKSGWYYIRYQNPDKNYVGKEVDFFYAEPKQEWDKTRDSWVTEWLDESVDTTPDYRQKQQEMSYLEDKGNAATHTLQANITINESELGWPGEQAIKQALNDAAQTMHKEYRMNGLEAGLFSRGFNAAIQWFHQQVLNKMK